MKKIIALLCLFVPFSVQAQQSYEEYLKASKNAFISGELEKALELLRQAEKLSGSDLEKAEAENAIGWVQHSLGSSEEAKKYLSEALEKAINAGDAELAQKSSNNLGVIYFSQGNLEEASKQFASEWSQGSRSAEEYLSKIREQKKRQQINSIISKGVSYRLNGEFDKAAAEYEKALQIDHEDVNALEYKGYALYRLNDYIGSAEMLKKAHSLSKEKISIIVNLLKVYCASGDSDAVQRTMQENTDILERSKEYVQNDRELLKICGDMLKKQ